MSRKNVVDVTFLLFSRIFRNQPIRCTHLTEVQNYFFLPFNRFCLTTCYTENYLINKNRDSLHALIIYCFAEQLADRMVLQKGYHY